MSLFLRLLRNDGCGRRFVVPHGAGGHRRFRRGIRYLRRFRRGGWNERRPDLHRHHRNDAGPSIQPVHPPAPLHPNVPAWLLAAPAAPRLEAVDAIDPALAAPPPPFWCPVHGWVVCPMHQYDFHVGAESAADDAAPLQPPTLAVVDVVAGAPLPTSLTVAVVDVDAVAPHLPTPTPATPPPSPRSGAHRRLPALGRPLASPSADSPTSSRGHRAGTWSPATLRLANGHLPDDSPSVDERGGSSPGRR